MAARKAISKKLRFEVFKRDGFKCQYCGRSAPDVILHVDHINPVKRGGRNDIMNLTTSCIDCNLGKGARTLDDNSVLERQRQQLQDINERREQLKMMTKWRDEMLSIEQDQLIYIDKRLSELIKCTLNANGRNDMLKTIKKYGFDETLQALEKSAVQYLEFNKDGEATQRSIDKFIDYIPKICNGMKLSKEHPEFKDISYICGIVRNRCTGYRHTEVFNAIRSAYEREIPLNAIKNYAKDFTGNSYYFIKEIDEW